MTEISPVERDVLLYQSGELSWWRRTTLPWRMSQDPEAMRLAETLALTELCLSRRPAFELVPGPRLHAIAGGIAALLLCMLALRTEAPTERTAPMDVAQAAPAPPAFTTARTLRHDLRQAPRVPRTFEPTSTRRFFADSPASRTSYLDLRPPRFASGRTN